MPLLLLMLVRYRRASVLSSHADRDNAASLSRSSGAVVVHPRQRRRRLLRLFRDDDDGVYGADAVVRTWRQTSIKLLSVNSDDRHDHIG